MQKKNTLINTIFILWSHDLLMLVISLSEDRNENNPGNLWLACDQCNKPHYILIAILFCYKFVLRRSLKLLEFTSSLRSFKTSNIIVSEFYFLTNQLTNKMYDLHDPWVQWRIHNDCSTISILNKLPTTYHIEFYVLNIYLSIVLPS